MTSIYFGLVTCIKNQFKGLMLANAKTQVWFPSQMKLNTNLVVENCNVGFGRVDRDQIPLLCGCSLLKTKYKKLQAYRVNVEG